MLFNELKVGAEIMYFGKKCSILSIDPPNVIIRRSHGDGETSEITFLELVTNPSFRPGKRMKEEIQEQENNFKSMIDALSPARREQVTFRFELIKPILVLERAKQDELRAVYEFMEFYKEYLLDSETIQDLTQEHLIERIVEKQIRLGDGAAPRGVSLRSIKRFLSEFREAEAQWQKSGENALISRAGEGNKHRTDNKELQIHHPKKKDVVLDTLLVRQDEKYLPIYKDVIENSYLSSLKISKIWAYQQIATKCIALGYEPPVKITVTTMLGRIDEKALVLFREGPKAFSSTFEPTERGYSNKEVLYPLHVVEIDHTQLDMDVIDKDGNVLDRPWITMGICVFSRVVWSLYISHDPPSANVVRKTIERGILFKRSRERFGTINEWDVQGIPSIFYMDNGTDFKSPQIRSLIKDTLKRQDRYRPRGTPRFGATIERLFGTINRSFIQQQLGSRKSNPKELGEYDPEADAVYTVEDIERALVKYITDVYHMSPHRGLPENSNTPIVRYYEGLKTVGLPEFVTQEDEETFKKTLLPTIMRPYTREGVVLENVAYTSPLLEHLIATRNTKYNIKYDIDDISKIYLLPPGTDEYIEVKAKEPHYESIEGVSRALWKLVRKRMKDESEIKRAKVPGTKTVLKALSGIQNDFAEAAKKGRKARTLAQRLKNDPTPLIAPKPTAMVPGRESSLDDLLAAARQAAEEKLTGGGR